MAADAPYPPVQRRLFLVVNASLTSSKDRMPVCENSHKTQAPGISFKVQEGGRPSYGPNQPQAAEMDK